MPVLVRDPHQTPPDPPPTGTVPERRSAGHRRGVLVGVAAVGLVGFVVFVVPQISGLDRTWQRVRTGHVWWRVLGTALEGLSIGAYVVVFRAVFTSGSARIGWRASAQITLAGDAATKLFAAAGAGGVALAVWALRASGLRSETVARGMVCLEVLLYAVYMAPLVIGGIGLRLGVFAGPAPDALTVVPALFGAVVILLALSTLRAEDRWERWLHARASRASGRSAKLWKRTAGVPRALADGLRAARVVAGYTRTAPLAAVAYWAFDLGALWASFHAFGDPPPGAVLVVGYFVGTLANTLPLTGGLGGVEGGMIGAFVGFGVHGSVAVLAVLAYRTISYWIPTLPGALAYVRLRGTVAGWRRPAIRH
jgi:putative heme transporter